MKAITKNQFLDLLKEELKHNNVPDAEDIIEEYEQHFSFKLADGYSEEEISAKLGDPKSLADQYDSVPAKQRQKGIDIHFTRHYGFLFRYSLHAAHSMVSCDDKPVACLCGGVGLLNRKSSKYIQNLYADNAVSLLTDTRFGICGADFSCGYGCDIFLRLYSPAHALVCPLSQKQGGKCARLSDASPDCGLSSLFGKIQTLPQNRLFNFGVRICGAVYSRVYNLHHNLR